MRSLQVRALLALTIAFVLAGPGRTARAQLGILTAAVGPGQITDADGNPGAWGIGTPIALGDHIVTPAGAYAMIFFVSGLGGTEIEFQGTIVVDVDENSDVEIRRGRGRRAPLDIHVTAGRVRAFFDAGEHKDYILLSTPLGRLQVTGSVIYAAHGFAGAAGTEFGSFDSQCRMLTAAGGELTVSQAQKVTLEEGAEPQVSDLTAADLRAWDSMPDMNFAAAAAQRSLVRVDFAGRAWVGEYLTGGQRLENVAAEASANIPSQEPAVVAVAPTTVGRVVTALSREAPPRLRTSSARVLGGTRRAVLPITNEEDNGFGREPSGHAGAPGSAAIQGAQSAAGRMRDARTIGRTAVIHEAPARHSRIR